MLLEKLDMRIMCAHSRAVARRENTTPEGKYYTQDGGGGWDRFSRHSSLEIPCWSMKSLSLEGKSVMTPVAPRSKAL